MDFPWMQSSPPFHHTLRASGQGEVWQDFTDEAKFGQYGWRCSTNEDAYSVATLIGNWSEKRFDTRRAKNLQRPLPSQFSHYFETTYSSTYNKEDRSPVYSTVKREPRIFPGHQPELDPPHTKLVPDSCYRLDFSRHGSNSSSAKPSTPELQPKREEELDRGQNSVPDLQ
ncbi:cilia- and flagella-associated protein 68 [Salminus brasiliensis]|uniref:cilia- and flagella-associated protein 68 n=1 Tax=Salminus brasiliensis TaxID=930266 RepID=UPI003B83150A